MSFANPSFLWAFSALLIPIGIHLLSRAEGRVIKIGSVRHFEESATSRFRSIRLNEVLLLLIRCALIAFLVLFLSGAQCTNTSPSPANWALVEKGLEQDPGVQPQLDSLAEQGFELKYFATGFPSLGTELVETPGNYWHLIGELKKKPLNNVIVFSASTFLSFRGKRVELPTNIRWVAVSPGKGQPFIQEATRTTKGVTTVMGQSNDMGTTFGKLNMTTEEFNTNIGIDSVQLKETDTIRIAIHNAPEFEYDKNVLLAALTTLEKEVPVNFQVSVQVGIAGNFDWVFNLSEEAMEHGKINAVRFSPTSSPTLFQMVNGSNWILTKRLDEEIALKHHLVIKLRDLMLPSTMVEDENDARVMPEKMTWAATSPEASNQTSTPFFDLHKYLVALLILTWVAERFVSYKRNM